MTDNEVELAEGEHIVTSQAELIFRQITEWMLDGDQIVTHAFGPTKSDEGKPSYARSSKVSAQEARDWHTNNARSRSLAVYAVTVGEVAELDRRVIDDSQLSTADKPLPPWHCYVDYRNLTRSERKTLYAHLWLRATERGEIHTVETPPDGQLPGV